MTARREAGLRSPFERDAELLQAIGRVISVWGAVSNITRVIAKELDCTAVKADTILKSFSGEASRLEFAARLIRSRPCTPHDDQMVASLDGLRDLAKERNLIVHGAPIHGGHRGENRPLGMYFVDFRHEEGPRRYVAAMPYLDAHLAKLRERGGDLFDLAYPELPPGEMPKHV